jgi:hypothetical protein
MSQETEKFLVRFPKGLRDRIADAAGLYRRSMNSEIVARLEQSLDGLPDPRVEQAVEPPFYPAVERMLRRDLTDEEELLVRAYRRLAPDRRLALLGLIT